MLCSTCWPAKPRSGYDLARVFSVSMANVWPAQHSQIYPELAKLLADGLIRQTGEGPRGRRIYQTSPAGLAELRSWLRDAEPDYSIRHPAQLRVFCMWALPTEEALALLDRDRAEYVRHLAQIDHALALASTGRPASSRASRLVIEFGRRFYALQIEWLELGRRADSGRHPAARQPAPGCPGRRPPRLGHGQVLGHLVVVDGLAAKNHVLPFQEHESLPLKEAPGQFACLRVEAPDLLLTCCRLHGLVELRSDPLPGRLGRTEQVVDVPVRLEVDEGDRAIVLVGRQQQQTTVTGPPMRLLSSPELGSPGSHLGGRVVGGGDLPDRAEEHIGHVGGIALFVGADGDFHSASVLVPARAGLASRPPGGRACL